MRAELLVSHGSGDFVAELSAIFGPNDPAVLAASAFRRNSPSASHSIAYAAQGAQYVLLAWPVQGQTWLYIEATFGDLRASAEHAWGAIRDARSRLRPDLSMLRLFDEESNDEVATASTGLAAHANAPELRLTAIVGLGSVAWLAAAIPTLEADADIVLGAIPAIFAGVVAVCTAVSKAASKKLVWR